VAAGDATIFVERICCLRKVCGTTLLVFARSLVPRISPQRYLLPYRDQLSSQGTPYRVLLSPKSQARFSFWPFGIFHTRPESVSCRNPRRLPFAILLSERRRGCNANCNWRCALSHQTVKKGGLDDRRYAALTCSKGLVDYYQGVMQISRIAA
jgi:hypothetical protein